MPICSLSKRSLLPSLTVPTNHYIAIILCSRPENEPNPVDLASFEEIFESRGAKRCWQPGRLTSPLALHYAFPANYERFCSAKTKLDKNLLLDSGYLQGTILSAAIKKR